MTIDQWVDLEKRHIVSLRLNYMQAHIPRYWQTAVGPDPLDLFEEGHFHRMIREANIRMDLAQDSQWLTDLPDWSLRALINKSRYNNGWGVCHPATAPDPRDSSSQSAWNAWSVCIDRKLDTLDALVSTEPHSTYHTITVGSETDIYPINFHSPDDWTATPDPAYLEARLYAIQYMLDRWNIVHPDPVVKPLIIIGPPDPGSHYSMRTISDRLPSARLVACFSYPFWDRLPGSLHADRSTTRTGQRRAIDSLRAQLDAFRSAFSGNRNIELWWIPQCFKQVDKVVDSDRWPKWEGALRYPTFEELRVQVSLALSRGIRGILWYGCASGYQPVPDSVQQWPLGVIAAEMREEIHRDIHGAGIPPHPWIENGCGRTLDPYDNLRSINREIEAIGSRFRKLAFDTTFTPSTIPAGNIAGLQAIDVMNDPRTEDILDVSTFTGPASGSGPAERYLMLVNRRLNDSDDPCRVAESVAVRMLFRDDDHTILTSVTDERACPPAWDSSISAFVCRDTLMPGEGKLYLVTRATGTDGGTLSVRAFPNPFTRTVRFEYHLPRQSAVTIRICAMDGKEIARLVRYGQSAGTHAMMFQAGPNLAAGTYLYELQADGRALPGKMLVRIP